MIYDCSVFNGEYDLLEIRLALLSPHVDKFIVSEGFETFSGNFKPLWWIERNKDRFDFWEDKIIYNAVMDYSDQEIIDQMNQRPYVDQGPFQRAFYQKESIRKVLEKLSPNDDDLIVYGDADEIINPEILAEGIDDKVYKLRQLAYSYFLNNRSSEDWRGTIITKWKNLKNGCLNDMRANPVNIMEHGGWHFTNLGGLEAIKKKLADYDHQEVNIPWVVNGLEERMEMNVDFLGRGYNCWQDESDLPNYIRENRFKYRHLWR